MRVFGCSRSRKEVETGLRKHVIYESNSRANSRTLRANTNETRAQRKIPPKPVKIILKERPKKILTSKNSCSDLAREEISAGGADGITSRMARWGVDGEFRSTPTARNM
jgi:hypothetical protein